MPTAHTGKRLINIADCTLPRLYIVVVLNRYYTRLYIRICVHRIVLYIRQKPAAKVGLHIEHCKRTQKRVHNIYVTSGVEMNANIALDSEIAKVEKVIDEILVELRTADYERRLVLYGRYIERTNYLTILYKKQNGLFDQGKTRCR